MNSSGQIPRRFMAVKKWREYSKGLEREEALMMELKRTMLGLWVRSKMRRA